MEIKVKGLCKGYEDKIALNELSFHIEEGMYGLLGANGAGKTTLIRILAGILEKDAGEISYGGEKIKDINEIRHRIGYIPQKFSFYPNMTVFEIMDYFSELNEVKKNKENIIKNLLEIVHLEECKRMKTKALSGGMKQRLGIAVSLIGNPDLLLVDEPTVGLDPMERIHFSNVLTTFSRDRTIIISSHIVSDIESTCKRLLILDNGRNVYDGTKDELMRRCKGSVWELKISEDDSIKFEKEYLVSKKDLLEDGVRLRVLSKEKPIESAYEVMPTLNDSYLFLVNKE